MGRWADSGRGSSLLGRRGGVCCSAAVGAPVPFTPVIRGIFQRAGKYPDTSPHGSGNQGRAEVARAWGFRRRRRGWHVCFIPQTARHRLPMGTQHLILMTRCYTDRALGARPTVPCSYRCPPLQCRMWSVQRVSAEPGSYILHGIFFTSNECGRRPES